LVSASAIGIYGDSGTVNVDERSDLGDNFLARVARDWEASAREAESYGVRTTIIRNGHIIGLGGLMKVFKSTTGLRIVPRPINGQVCFSWIHQYDAVKIYLEAMAEPLAPPVINAVAPRISTYGEFSREIARQTKSKVIPVPVEVSKLFLGDFVSELSLSQCVKSKMLSSNFKFKYGSIEKAIKEVLKN
jgi:NAD dependent epimerase/dehydratase family enzyme